MTFSLGTALRAEPALEAVKDIALYQGQDRDQRLLSAARKEGALTLYTSMNAEDLKKLVAAFEKKHGIKVNVWRASSEKVLQKVIAENNAGKQTWDIVESNGPELESMVREKLSQKFYSPHKKDLIQETIPKHEEYLPTRLNVFVQAYNKNKVRPDEVPKTYQDLLHPRWKGRLGVELEDADWMAGLVKAMGEKEGIAYFKKLSDQNISKRKGHALLSQMVVSGEVPLALTVYNYKIEQFKQDGAPVEWLALQPAVVRPNGVVLYKNAPHPNAGLLFADFLLSDAQKLLLELSHVPANTKVETKLNKFQMHVIDPSVILDEWDKWSRMWNEIIINPVK
jgi:iron(III) transport system substrate-binding protein